MVRHQTGIDVVLIYLDLNDVSTWDKRLSFIGPTSSCLPTGAAWRA